MIPYVDNRLRAWASWRLVCRGYYRYSTVLGDLRTEGSGRATTTAAPGSRTRAITRDWEDREPLECELILRHLPGPACTFVLLIYVGVHELCELERLAARPRPLDTEQLMGELSVSRATVYNRLHSVHSRILDALNEPRLDDLVAHVHAKSVLDTVTALRQNRPHSAKVGISTPAA